MGIRGRFPSSAPELTTLLFDLDGTLVEMRRRGLELRFLWCAMLRFRPAIYPWRFKRSFWRAAERMQKHGTDRLNFEIFVETLAQDARVPVSELAQIAHRFIAEDFVRLADRFVPITGAKEILEEARELGYEVVLATNAVWPLAAVKTRLKAGRLGDFPFAFISHSEIMTRCKPDPAYYAELLTRLERKAECCLMIGNDPRKDLPAKEVGIRTFLVDGPDLGAVDDDPRLDGRGTFDDLRAWLRLSKEERWPSNQSSSA